eukprot:TRINITY_DN93800_c0_g1_i1.p1 TRINITY_DN93800_c0_g1~~TRINITY_DN93800_c0_g1_i1.p1  ORF type:complete len:659 (+),score=64.35 TRINITY_DN93800_c0_g1_i1:113-2089(+)
MMTREDLEILEFKEWATVPYVHGATITLACYGAGARVVDVTSAVQAHLAAERCCPVTNETFGCDPAPGEAKVLHLTILKQKVVLPDEAFLLEVREWDKIKCDHIESIFEAKWGAEDVLFVDVLEPVLTQFANSSVITASNDVLCCDPCPGLGKVLRLTVMAKKVGLSCCPACVPEQPLGGGTSLVSMVEAWEGEVLSLPSGTVGRITGCSYGAGDVWVDPRQWLESQLQANGSLQVTVGSEELGGDPVPGRVKSLRLSYTIHPSRQRLADEGDWEIHEGCDVSGDIEFCMSGPGMTEADVIHARRRCLLLGCGGFRLTTGTCNQFGDQDGPPGCEQLRFTQDQIRTSLKHRVPHRQDSLRNKNLRPGIHIAPAQFQADTVWRPGNDPAPAPWIGFKPTGRYCAVATQLCVPAEGLADSTYYMFGGFFCGYGGIQQLGNGRQTITFSVWNANIGERAETLETGPGARASNFDGEGMGCGVVYEEGSENVKWSPGNIYTWLLRALPDGHATVFSAYIYKPEIGEWQFIASHCRPDPEALEQGRVESPGGFLEDPGHTAQRRMARYGPCWVQRPNGIWEAVVRCEAGDGCTRPNKAIQLSADGRSVELIAGGAALPPPPGANLGPTGGFRLHRSFDLQPVPPPSFLLSAPGELPKSGWAMG